MWFSLLALAASSPKTVSKQFKKELEQRWKEWLDEVGLQLKLWYMSYQWLAGLHELTKVHQGK